MTPDEAEALAAQVPPLGEWGHFEPLPDPIPPDPYDEDGYCRWCGSGEWKFHAPPCVWANISATDGRGARRGRRW